MAAIQARFEVAVPELPDHIDPASYSESRTLPPSAPTHHLASSDLLKRFPRGRCSCIVSSVVLVVLYPFGPYNIWSLMSDARFSQNPDHQALQIVDLNRASLCPADSKD